MFAANADIYAPDDAGTLAGRQETTSNVNAVPSIPYAFKLPNTVVGVIGLAALALLVHHWRK